MAAPQLPRLTEQLARDPITVELNAYPDGSLLFWGFTRQQQERLTAPYGALPSLRIRFDPRAADTLFRDLADCLGYDVPSARRYRGNVLAVVRVATLPRGNLRRRKRPTHPAINLRVTWAPAGSDGHITLSAQMAHRKALSLCRRLAPILGWELIE